MTSNGDVKVYGDFFDAKMIDRMARDKIPSAHRVVFKQRHYGVRGYVIPATPRAAVIDGAGNTAQIEQVYFYSMRRDGRVGRSWVPLSKSDVLEWGVEVRAQ
jgi:hypothetical protein